MSTAPPTDRRRYFIIARGIEEAARWVDLLATKTVSDAERTAAARAWAARLRDLADELAK